MKFQDLPDSSSGNYLKFKDKDSVTLVIKGDPVLYSAVWTNNRYEFCSPDTPKATTRFRVNVVFKDRDTGELVSKIWEGPKRLYKQLHELNEEYDLDTIYLKVTRYGSGTDTEYSVLPAKEKRSKEADRILNSVPLQELGIREPVTETSDIDVPF